jgi:hypothetical protein
MRFGLVAGLLAMMWAFMPFHLNAQSGTASAGGDFSHSSVQWSYTLGQVFHLTLGSGNQPLLNQGVQQTYQDNKILGFLRYDNTSLTPLNNSTVQLGNAQATPIRTALTSSTGAYELNQFPDGAYVVTATTAKPWGGVNATDALRVRQHFTGSTPLQGLRLKGADVNATSSINSADALLITRRFSNLVTSFNVGDWCFDAVTVQANGQVQNLDLKGLAFGDVNGSYIPANVREPVRLALNYEGLASAAPQGTWLPVSSIQALDMAALSVVAQVPAGLQVVDVRTALPLEDLSWTCRNGEFRLGWSRVQGIRLGAGDPLFEVKAVGHSEVAWDMQGLSEIAGTDGQPLEWVELRIPQLTNRPSTWNWRLYPNPASEEARFEWTVPGGLASVRVDLYDSRGRLVWSENYTGFTTTTTTSLSIPVTLFAEGKYVAKIQMNSGGQESYSPLHVPIVVQRTH